MRFFLKAIAAHSMFSGLLIACQQYMDKSESAILSWLVYGLACCIAVGFYFKVDYFFMNPWMHRALATRRIGGRPLSAASFVAAKAVVWIYAIATPVAGLLLTLAMPLGVKVYLCMAYTLSLGLLSSYLFRSYSEYIALRASNKWGLLAVW